MALVFPYALDVLRVALALARNRGGGRRSKARIGEGEGHLARDKGAEHAAVGMVDDAPASRSAAAAGIDGEAFRGVEGNCWFLLYRLRSRRCHSAGRSVFGSCIVRLCLLGGGARGRKAVPMRAAGQFEKLSFAVKARFCVGWTG